MAFAHWREIAIDQDTTRLDLAVARYEQMDAAGHLLFVTARVAGEAVGYHCTFIGPHIHYAKSITGYIDGFYLRPDHRLDRNALDLFAFVDAEVARRGVERMYASCMLHADLLPLFRATGWTELERTFTKRLRAA